MRVASAAAALLPCAVPRPADRRDAWRFARPHGPAALFLLMLTVIVSDTAQYFVGRAFGRRPLAPAISPKKTIEGAIGGFVFGTLRSSVVGRVVAAVGAGAVARAARRDASSRSASPAICSSRC